MIVADCPSQELLAAYSLGKLSEAEMQELEQHLDGCDSCSGVVDAVDREDSLLGLLGSGDRATASHTEFAGDAYEQAATDLKRRLRGESTALPLGGRLGPYTLIEAVGSGGMGHVYRALHRRLNKTVAIKLLPHRHNFDSLAVARFDREVTAVGALEHAAIVQATDAGEVEGVPYLVMQFIDGLDLSALLRVTGALPTAAACEVVRQAAIALAYAHDHGIVHRDVKPSNLMLERNGQVKVLDLGLARMSVSFQPTTGLLGSLTGTGQLLGTLDYMSPEQAHDGDVDARTDVYGLGATLYKLLIGRAVGELADESTSPLSRLHRRSTIDGIDFHDVPTAVVPLLRRMLHPDPEQRLSSALEAAELLEEHCQGAELKVLLENAQQVAAERQSLMRSAATRAGSGSATTHPESADRLNPNRLESSGDNGRGRRGILTGIAAAGWFALLTVIVLQTRRGQIVIESDQPGVEVSVLRNGKVYDQLTVQTDAKSLKLYADRYEIRLPSADGKLQVTPNEIQLRQGQTVVVRVTERTSPPQFDHLFDEKTQDPKTQSVIDLYGRSYQMQSGFPSDVERVQGADRSAEAEEPSAREPLYQGKTLSSWLQIVRYERDPKLIRVALDDALPHLTGRETNARIQRTLLERLSEQSYRDRRYFELIDLDTGTTEGRIAQWLSGVENILTSDQMAEALAPGDPNLQAAGLRVAVTVLLDDANEEISQSVSDRIAQLCDSDVSEITFGAHLAKLLVGSKFSPEQLQLAEQLVSHANPYIAYLGAKVLTDTGSSSQQIEALKRLQTVVATHPDLHLVSESARLLEKSQSHPEITRLTAEAVLALQNRGQQNAGIYRLQNQLLRAIEQSGRHSEATLSTLQTVLKNRYQAGPPVYQSKLAAGQPYTESMEGLRGNALGMGMEMESMMGMMGMMGGDGYGAGEYMMEDMMGGGYGGQMQEPMLRRKISFGNFPMEAAGPNFSDVAPRTVIDAIFALTGETESWDEPIGETAYAKDVHQWLTTEQAVRSNSRRTDVETYAEHFFPRSLYPKLILRGLSEYAKSLPASIEALGVTAGGAADKRRPTAADVGAMGGMRMDYEMGMGGYGDMGGDMEMDMAGMGGYDTAAEQPIPDQFRVGNLSAARLPFAQSSPLYSRLALETLKDPTLSGRPIRAAVLRHWEESLDPRERSVVGYLHLPSQDDTRWQSEAMLGRNDLDRGVALRVAIRISNSEQAKRIAQLIDRQIREPDDGSSQSMGAEATAFLADATAYRLVNAKQGKGPADQGQLFERPLNALLGKLVQSADARDRLFAMWLSARTKIPLSAEQYRQILATEIPAEIVDKQRAAVVGHAPAVLNLRQTVQVNSQWLSEECEDAYLRANPKSAPDSLHELKSTGTEGTRLIDYSRRITGVTPSELDLVPGLQ